MQWLVWRRGAVMLLLKSLVFRIDFLVLQYNQISTQLAIFDLSATVFLHL